MKMVYEMKIAGVSTVGSPPLSTILYLAARHALDPDDGDAGGGGGLEGGGLKAWSKEEKPGAWARLRAWAKREGGRTAADRVGQVLERQKLKKLLRLRL